MNTKEKIIVEYQKVIEVHPSYSVIAKKVGVSKTYVYQTIKDWLRDNRPTAGQM